MSRDLKLGGNDGSEPWLSWREVGASNLRGWECEGLEGNFEGVAWII